VKARAVLLFLLLALILSPLPSCMAAGMEVSIGDYTGRQGETVDVPIKVSEAENVGSMDITLEFDPSVLALEDVKRGTLTQKSIVEYNAKPGLVKILINDLEGFTGSGSVAVVKFKVVGAAGSLSGLNLKSVEANDADTFVDKLLNVESGSFRVKAERAASSLSCTVSPLKLKVGETVTVSGLLTPGREAAITLTFTKPDGSKIEETITSKPDGSYSYTYSPDVEGSWRVKASWPGSENYKEASSPPASFTVEKPACIIATSTFGSELSPEVQFLRGFRDHLVMETFAGSQFMLVFNAWYYSFSPSVAGFIYHHQAVRPLMRALLYPLIGILHLASATHAAFAFHPELGVVMAGLAASSLIGAVYFSIPALAILEAVRRLKGRMLNPRQFRLWVIPLLASMVLMVSGELTASPIVMMISTALFVLTMLTFTATLVGFGLSRRLHGRLEG